MLKLSLKPGEYITLGDNIKIVFSGGSANNIHLLVPDASSCTIRATYVQKRALAKMIFDAFPILYVS